MLVEFVGCSGAGKTTLLSDVRTALSREGVESRLSTVVIASVTRTQWVRDDTIRNGLLNFFLLPWMVRSFHKTLPCYRLALRVLWRDVAALPDRISRFRSLVRLLVSNELLKPLGRDHLIFVDEGVIGGIHNLFVHPDFLPRQGEVEQYLQSLWLPDVIVHVDVPLSLAIARTLQRPDPPLRGRQARSQLETFVRHGREIFASLSKVDYVKDRFFTFLNKSENPEETQDVIRQITETIMRKILDD